jgi:nitrogen fixation protein FixH
MRRFITIVVFTVFAATIGTILVGSRTFEGVVVEHPYEAGLAWDETQKQAAKLGWRVVFDHLELKQGENSVVLQLIGRNGSALEGASVEVTLSRPSTNEYDRTYQAKPLGMGRYQVSLLVPLIGLWDLRTVAARGGESFTTVDRMEAVERTK